MGEIGTRVGTADLSDLIAGAVAGSEEARNGLVGALAPSVWAEACGSRLDRQGAADVSRAVWLRLVDHLDQSLPGDQLGDWLVAVTRRETERLERLQGII